MPAYVEIVRKEGVIIITTDKLSLSNKAFINVSAVDIKTHRTKTLVVLITGWGRELSLKRIRERGMDFLLAKPFRLTDVSNTVAEAIGSITH